MDENRVRALARLDELGIPYDLSEHPAVYTIAEMDALQMEREEEIAKNLFLRDKKGKRHFLVMLKKDKTADLALLAERIGCDRLSFASEERLGRYPGLVKGAVTPLGVVNDTEALVEDWHAPLRQHCHRVAGVFGCGALCAEERKPCADLPGAIIKKGGQHKWAERA